MLRPLPWYLCLSLKYLFPSQKRPSFFGLVSILGVALGVLVLMVVNSVMNGLGSEIEKRLQELHGDIRIEGQGIIYESEPLIAKLKADPAVLKASAYAQGIVMVQHAGRPAFPHIRSIMSPEDEVIPISTFMQAGKAEALGEDSVLVSAQLAKSLHVQVGSTLEIYTPLMLEYFKNDEILLPKTFVVQGIFQSGWNAADANTLLCTLPAMQELYGLDEGIHGIALRLRTGTQVDPVVHRLESTLAQYRPGLRAFSWMEIDPDLMVMLRLEKTTLFFVIVFIILIASFSIASSLTTIIVKKTKEIGLLLALGAQPKAIALCFAFQGLVVGTLGTMLGLGLAYVGLYFRNPITHTLARWTHSEDAMLKYYQLVDIPVLYVPQDILLIALCGIGLATLAACLPALRILKLQPVDALRSE